MMPYVMLKRKPWFRYQLHRPAQIRKVYRLLIRAQHADVLSWWCRLRLLWQSVCLTRYVPYRGGD